MSKITLITGDKGRGKTTKLHECLQNHHKDESKAVYTPANLESATKVQLKKIKVIGVETTTLDELEAVLHVANSCERLQFYVTTPLEVKNKLTEAELANFEVIEVAVTLP